METPFRRYFPTEVVFTSVFSEKNLWKAFFRPLGTREVRQKFTKLLDDFHPDVVHLNNIHTHLSPVLAEIAHKRQIRVVWTLHDYKLLCPRYDCLRKGRPCELCLQNKIAVLKHNCMKANRLAGFLAFIEAIKWNRKKLEKYTDLFICPSEFMKNKMLAGGFDLSKLKVLPNFTDLPDVLPVNDNLREKQYVYLGRISKEKGIEILLAAAQQAGYPLLIAGDGPLLNELKNRYESETIRFLGHQTRENAMELIRKARFTVLPSIWYENNPLSVIESLCMGTPVLGSDMGGIPELIAVGKNGMIFESGNTEDLVDKIHEMFSSSEKFDYAEIRAEAVKKFSGEKYYLEIMEIYCAEEKGYAKN
jgi:glycosyltransferase involved in cell wall biosynthesis